jgi:hypothetical protein
MQVPWRVNSLTTSFSKDGSLVTAQRFSFPMTLDVVFPVNDALFGLPP